MAAIVHVVLEAEGITGTAKCCTLAALNCRRLFLTFQCLRTDSLESVGEVSSSLGNPTYMTGSSDTGNLLSVSTLHQHPCNSTNNNSNVNYSQQPVPNNHTNGSVNVSSNLQATSNSNNQMHPSLRPVSQRTHTTQQQQELISNLQHIKQDYDLTTL